MGFFINFIDNKFQFKYIIKTKLIKNKAKLAFESKSPYNISI